ncbi:MAG: AAA family ATPase [Deltaproteobacteria bacterium]|nr:AAA family ATPase [Deltaproteobacteria bacterium]
MEPFALLALATAAGFVFNKITGQRGGKNPLEQRELLYSRDIVARPAPDNSSEFDFSSIEIVPEYRLVKALVEHQFPLIFVTGGAGTGKSTLVRWIMHEFRGSVLLGAPTAISAINIGGRTLHSLCQLPPRWIVKDDIQLVPGRKEIQEANLLIIDEISMVTANLLDGVSGFLRLNRKVDKPFGGIPVIMVGDMFQLPPVVKKSSRTLFEHVYGSAKFYNAKCLRETTYYGVELKKTYRQSDQRFVDLLSRLREGVDLSQTLTKLNSGCAITGNPGNGAVWLSPRNVEVNSQNIRKLAAIKSQARTYRGESAGRFKTGQFPSPVELTLKVGAQVMFSKNDPAGRWISGTVGKVQRMLDEKIFVQLEGSNAIVDVGRSRWVKYHYGWNPAQEKIERTETGSYTQFPLILAWAITVHKSQGKTIERVHLDLGDGAFETGQTYVALSRCRSMKNLSMARHLTPSDILVDFESKQFYDHLRNVIKNLPLHTMMNKLGLH